MATVQKTTMRRYNGTDWDTIYFTTASDITVLGDAATVKKDETGFAYGDVLESTDTVFTLLTKVINRLTTLELEHIDPLEKGEGITSIDATKITGIIDRKNLPADVSGKGVEVDDEEAKDALTAADVNTGDIVKAGGSVYLVTGVTPAATEGGKDTITYMSLADNNAAITWNRITGTPTTVAGYGITDAVKTADLANKGGEGAEEKVAQANLDGELDFDITGSAAKLGGQLPAYYATAAGLKEVSDLVTEQGEKINEITTGLENIDASKITKGTLPLSVIPKAAIPEIHIVTSVDDLANLTTEQVQVGDTIKIADELNEDGSIKKAGAMYYVSDETKLGTDDYMDGLIEYTAGIASAVDWKGVQNTPTTLAGYGITDAVNTNQLANKGGLAAANKVAQANADGKLEFDITGDAGTLGGNAPEYYATAENLTKLTDKYNVTAETVKTLVETVLGTSGEEPPVSDPTEDPSNDAYIEPVRNAAVGADVTWATKVWMVLSKDEDAGTTTLIQKATDDVVAGSTIAEAVANYKTNMSEDALSRMADLQGGATQEQLNAAPFTDDTSRIALNGSGDPTGYWTITNGEDGDLLSVDATGAIVDTVAMTDTLGFRPVAVLNVASKGVAPTGTLVDRVEALETTMGDETTAGTVLYEIKKLKEGATIEALDASKIEGVIDRKNLPADISGRLVEVADTTAMYALTATDVAVGDLVKLDSGEVYYVKDVANLTSDKGYTLLVDVGGSSIEWSQIKNTPTTLADYGITDAVNVDDVIVDGIYDAAANPDVAGKIVKVGDDNKLHVDIAGDAATLGGHDPDYFVDKATYDALALQVPILLNSLDDLANPGVGQMVMIPVNPTTTEPETPGPTNPDEGYGTEDLP